jgi:hypothetical protein
MKLITCPEVYVPCLGDFSVFLGGGITGCDDWQSELAVKLSGEPDLILVNPRRQHFDITNASVSFEQRNWEYHNIKNSYLKLFWYPNTALCPITLYETGVSAARGDNMVVGVQPGYARIDDVVHQLEMIRPDVKVVYSLNALCAQVRARQKEFIKCAKHYL